MPDGIPPALEDGFTAVPTAEWREWMAVRDGRAVLTIRAGADDGDVYEVALKTFRATHADSARKPDRWESSLRAAVDAALALDRARVAAEIAEARRERDLAIAHDSQPYPTADAYEAACAALQQHRERADRAEAALRDERSAFHGAIADGSLVVYRD